MDHPTDRRGFRRSPVTLPEYRRGKPAANKGMRLAAEILPPDEVRALLESFGTSPIDLRNRAMATLMYRAALKMVQVVALERADYDRRTAKLTVPWLARVPKREVVLDLPARRALDAWMDTRKSEGISLSAPMFCVLNGPTKGMRVGHPYVRETLKKQAARAGIERRVGAEGLKQSGELHRKRAQSRVAAHLSRYLNDESFQLRFPAAFERWESALDQFATHPTRHADRIGHDCRAAMSSFIDGKLTLHGLCVGGGTVTKLRELIAHADVASDAIAAHLQSIVRYWGATADLAQRQEHGARREGETLSADDSDRLISYTILVMLEIDRSLPEPVQ